jgi:thiol-disulfide isomerase/thioredoxin
MLTKILVRWVILTVAALTCSTQSTLGQAKIVSLNQLQELISTPADQIKIINFWATWCAPCVKELPLFEEIHKSRNDVTVFLVSLDLDLDPDAKKVDAFINRKHITADVYILNESNSGSWIDKIDSSWTGALPATLILNTRNGKKTFIERTLKLGELELIVEDLKN